MVKLLPTSDTGYKTYPIQNEDGDYVDGVIEVKESDLVKIGRTLKFSPDRTHLEPYDGEAVAMEAQGKIERINKLRAELKAYTEDFAQASAGITLPDLEERKALFRKAHAELRQLLGKGPRGGA